MEETASHFPNKGLEKLRALTIMCGRIVRSAPNPHQLSMQYGDLEQIMQHGWVMFDWAFFESTI